MKLIHDATSGLLRLLLLAELFVHSWSRPTHSPLCGLFGSMNHHLGNLKNLSKKLHGLTDDELINFEAAGNTLNELPHIHFTAGDFTSLEVNKTLSQMFVYTQSFRLHVDWLKTAQENVSLNSQSAKRAGSQLLQLSNNINASLTQISEAVPQSPSPSLPVVSTAFDVLQFSVEISERLKVFCDWSSRQLLRVRKLSKCPRH